MNKDEPTWVWSEAAYADRKLGRLFWILIFMRKTSVRRRCKNLELWMKFAEGCYREECYEQIQYLKTIYSYEGDSNSD